MAQTRHGSWFVGGACSQADGRGNGKREDGALVGFYWARGVQRGAMWRGVRGRGGNGPGLTCFDRGISV